MYPHNGCECIDCGDFYAGIQCNSEKLSVLGKNIQKLLKIDGFWRKNTSFQVDNMLECDREIGTY